MIAPLEGRKWNDMTVWTSSQCDLADRTAQVAPASVGRRTPRWLSPRRILALGLLTVSALTVAAQFHTARSSAAAGQDPYFQRVTLDLARQRDGTLMVNAPITSGDYSVDLIFPGGSPPLDFGIAYQEARKHVKVEVRDARQSAPLLSVPSRQSLSQLEDQLDSHAGVKLCEFQANSKATLIIHCHVIDGPPWPEQLTIGLSHSNGQSPVRASGRLTRAGQPLSLGLSALLVCASASLLWRSA